MILISYTAALVFISLLWLLLRAVIWFKNRRVNLRREVQLLLVFICLLVVVRFTFFPFAKLNGQIQPLILDPARLYPFRINLVPLVRLMDYPVFSEAMLNLIGNIAMFLPLGIVWPSVFRELNHTGRALAAGVGVSLFIEILQLPFFDRVTDIDDLLLNTLGYLLGYAIYRLCRRFFP